MECHKDFDHCSNGLKPPNIIGKMEGPFFNQYKDPNIKQAGFTARRWFQIFFIFKPISEMIQFDDHIFRMGWNNHQLSWESLLTPGFLLIVGSKTLLAKNGPISLGKGPALPWVLRLGSFPVKGCKWHNQWGQVGSPQNTSYKWWFPKILVPNNHWFFPTKNDQHLGCEMGVPRFKETPKCWCKITSPWTSSHTSWGEFGVE